MWSLLQGFRGLIHIAVENERSDDPGFPQHSLIQRVLARNAEHAPGDDRFVLLIL